MTVDGVSTTIRPGRHRGKLLLTPADEVIETFNEMGLNDTYYYRTALYIDNGAVVPGKSVTGDSNYLIDGARVDFTGNGGKARVTINNANIRTRGGGVAAAQWQPSP